MFNPTSPGVYTQEIDTTNGVQPVSISLGGMVGTFNWGPVLEITNVVSGADLNQKFGTPDSNTANSFFSAWNFLQYSQNLDVVRNLTSGMKNATSNGNGTIIMNASDYFNNVYPTIAGAAWSARYPAALGNSLEVLVWDNAAVWTANSSNTTDPLYVFANQFEYAPNTSPYVANKSNNAVTKDEIHVLVVDRLGLITGTANSVLERWPSLSRISDSQSPSGVSNYYVNYLYQNSKWIYGTGIPSSNANGWGISLATAIATPSLLTDSLQSTANVLNLSAGADGNSSAANTVTAQGIICANDTTSNIGLFFTGDGGQTEVDQAIAYAEQLKSFVVFASPPLANVTNPAGPATAIVNWTSGLTRSTFAFIDSGWKYQYDQWNNVYRWVPLNGDVAGLWARSDATNAPWWSAAGQKRGQILNCIKLAYNPGLNDRNVLYPNAVNPVVNLQGQGTQLYGDKTFINYASVFSRMNVRRLFIILEQTISQAAQAQLFEFNDVYTQSAFVNMVTPFLRQVKGGRGITKFEVIADGRVNTPDIINANKFAGQIYVVPNQSINYIMLSFVAVDAGVSFSYATGQVNA